MRINAFFLASATLFLAGCSLFKSDKELVVDEPVEVVELPEIEVVPEEKIYNPSRTKYHDLMHTRLDVSFDWEKQRLNGEATLTLKPWFYPSKSLTLDAKGMNIHEVAIVEESGNTALKWSYDSLFLNIELDKLYNRSTPYSVYIKYTAKPNELPEGGSAAISSDKGLYFINPDSTETNKPTQIWTQGETEASSCWFPTIDSPNERTTQEIYITVEDKYKTLSNGELVYSNFNADGTRTDYWNMELPHAPYLFMMAIGDFSVARDAWERPDGDKMIVDYYVEPEYEAYAFDIFGNTPEMITYYSEALDYPYPWSKYSQVVVRDYVSGAMENTTATVHGEFLHATSRELLDGDNEAIIAHELFHQWFGDIVTCESWANLPLNESFATYGEYLWFEHKYGKDRAEDHGYSSMQGYFAESRGKNVDLIRFDYIDKEDMFDGHSYNKGGRVLHMLRNVVGDEAFFASLNRYLKDNEYQDVEIHNLRLAFEAVTGQDLNWFFNQWFLDNGHPVLDIDHNYVDSLGIYELTISQTQDIEEYPVYRLPMAVDIWNGDQVERHNIVVDDTENLFTFTLSAEPDLVNVDADKVLLAKKKDDRELSTYVHQFYHAGGYLDRLEALNMAERSEDPMFDKVIIDALKDPYYGIREIALSMVEPIVSRNPEIELHLNRIIEHDPKSVVRSAAINVLSSNYSDNSYKMRYEQLLGDSSYAVIASALGALYQADPKRGVEKAAEFEDEDNLEVIMSIAEIYTQDASPKHNNFFLEKLDKVNGFSKFGLVQAYTGYLNGQSPEVVNKGLPVLEDVARNSNIWWMKFSGYQALAGLAARYENERLKLESQLEMQEQSETRDEEAIANLKQAISEAGAQQTKVETLLSEIKADETDPRIKGVLGE